jgi:hypothetical protein
MGFDTSKINAALSRLPKQFKGQQAKIGWPSGKEYPDGTSVAYVAAIQNFGVPEKSIPPRPMLKPTVAENQDRWAEVMKHLTRQVAAGELDAVDALDGVGRVAAMDLQATIAQINEPALSPVTVLLRKWRKQGRTITGKTVGEAAAAIAAGAEPGTDNKPLNDTGYLIASVTHGVGKDDGNFAA